MNKTKEQQIHRYREQTRGYQWGEGRQGKGRYRVGASLKKKLLQGYSRTSLVAQMVKSLPAMQETQVQSLGWEDPLKKGMATHSSIHTWETPRTEEPAGIHSPWDCKRVRYDWATNTHGDIESHVCETFQSCKALWNLNNQSFKKHQTSISSS